MARKKTAVIDGMSVETVNISSNITVEHVTYNRTFTPGAVSTVMLPFSYTCNGSEGGTFYEFVGVEKENNQWIATMKAVGDDANNVSSLEANTPYLFMPSGTEMSFPNISGSVTLNTTGDGSTQNGDWTFKGTYQRLTYGTAPMTGHVYGFASTTKEVDGVTVKQGEFVHATDVPSANR